MQHTVIGNGKNSRTAAVCGFCSSSAFLACISELTVYHLTVQYLLGVVG